MYLITLVSFLQVFTFLNKGFISKWQISDVFSFDTNKPNYVNSSSVPACDLSFLWPPFLHLLYSLLLAGLKLSFKLSNVNKEQGLFVFTVSDSSGPKVEQFTERNSQNCGIMICNMVGTIFHVVSFSSTTCSPLGLKTLCSFQFHFLFLVKLYKTNFNQ